MKRRVTVAALIFTGVLVTMLARRGSFAEDWAIVCWVVGFGLFLAALSVAVSGRRKSARAASES